MKGRYCGGLGVTLLVVTLSVSVVVGVCTSGDNRTRNESNIIDTPHFVPYFVPLPLVPPPPSSIVNSFQRIKRYAQFDLKSCKGLYVAEYFIRLEKVCDDCFNLYRRSSISIRCR